MTGEWFEHMAGLPSGEMPTETVTVYEIRSKGRLVEITTDTDAAEQHSREHGRTVTAETTGVSL